MQIKRLAGDTAIYGISSIVARLLNYLLTPYLTRVLTQAEYGVVTDAYSLIPFVLVLLTMGMESGYFKFAGIADSVERKQEIFTTLWSSVTLVSLLFLGVVAIFIDPISEVLRYGDDQSFVWMIVGLVAIDSITAIPFARLRQEGRSKQFVLIRVISILVNMTLCIGCYSLLPRIAGGEWFNPDFGAGYVFAANLGASFIVLLIMLSLFKFSLKGFSFSTIKIILLYSLPLLLSGVAGTANEFIDRQMIKYLLPEDLAMSSLGIYGAVVKIGVILLLFTQMYRMAAEPFFLSNFKREEFVQINAEALKYFIIISITMFLGITLFVDILALLLDTSFREGMYILPVVLVGNILSGVVFNLSFWYKQLGKTKFALFVTLWGVFLTILFNVILVPRLGYYGAAVARLICEVGMVALSYYLNRKYYPTPYDLRRIGEYVLLGIILYGLGSFSEEWDAVSKYFYNFALLSIFVVYATWRERIHLIVISKFKK